jgi:molecular chaperone HscC
VALREHFMTDICPYTLGVAVSMEDQFGNLSGGHFLPVIERNSTIPCSKVVRGNSVFDNQKHIQIDIYQGESRLVENNLKLGGVSLSIPPRSAGEVVVDVRYTYDINGILEVEVTNPDSGETKREVIINSEMELSEEEIEESLRRLAHLKMHPRENSRNRFLIERGERLYEESLSRARAEIDAQIRRFEAVLDRQDTIEIERAARELEEFLKLVEDSIF